MSAYELNKTILKNSANLKAYYRFESGALTTDSSGNAHTLTPIGTPTEDASGKYGGAVAYASASSQAHSAVDHADFKPTGAFSIGAWIKTSSSGTNQFIFQSYSQNTNHAGIWLRVRTGGDIDVLSGKNSGTSQGVDFQIAITPLTYNDGAWHHVVGTGDGTNLRVYVDGKCVITTAWANNPVYAATNYVRVGCRNNAGTNAEFFNGSIDDLFVLNGTALSADQIKELYEGRYIGEWMPQSGLVGLWHLNGNSTDLSGNNYHLTDTAVTYSLANGKFNQGASFNGTTSKSVISSNLGIDGGNITMILWVNLSSAANDRCHISQLSSTSKVGYYIYTNQTTGVFKFSRVKKGVAENAASKSQTVTTGIWYQLALVYDGTNVYGYINGNQVGSTASSGSGSTASTSGTSVGAEEGSGAYTAGSIDEVAIFSRALTAAEIRHWYAWSRGKYL